MASNISFPTVKIISLAGMVPNMLFVFQSGVAMGKAVVMQKFGAAVSSVELFDAGTPLLPGFSKEKAFEF